MSARIVLVGASGTVGRQLVPLLRAQGAELLLIGRDAGKLRELFPEAAVGGYEDIQSKGHDFDALVFLTTLNNDQDGSYEDFQKVNVELALRVCGQAVAGNIGQFVYLSSTHALDETNGSHYARTKREAVAALGAQQGISTRVVYLPAVVGTQLGGRLGALQRLPQPIAKIALTLLQALKPTVHVDKVADALLQLVNDPERSAQAVLISDEQRGNPAYGIIKRAIDLTSAVLIVVLLWWAMAIIWIMVKVQSPGPGIFSQVRVGRKGQTFTCYKFRTMQVSAPNVATHEAPASFVTPLGGFLRRTKLDELPQVFNILANQMSLVGPRPCLPSQTELVEERRKRGVLDILPGITGLGQVHGIDMSNPTQLAQWDERYLKLRSLLLDLKLIVQTGLGKGSGDRVRPNSP